MYVVNIVLMTLLATAVGLSSAVAAAWLFWTALKPFHHAQWGPVIAFIAIVAMAYPSLQASQISQMLVLFSALVAIACWVSPSSSDLPKSVDRTRLDAP